MFAFNWGVFWAVLAALGCFGGINNLVTIGRFVTNRDLDRAVEQVEEAIRLGRQ